MLTGAVHPDAEVARERNRLVERITVARAQPRTIAREALQRKRFGTHPIAREMPTGPDVAAVEPADVRALHAAGLVPGGAILTLVGDLDPHDAVALVEQRLAGWTAPHPARRLTAPPPVAPSNLELVHRAGSVQSQLRMSAPGVCPASTRATPRCSWRTSSSAATSPPAWMENIREDKGYTYGAHSGTEFVPGGAVLSVETDVASDVTAAALLETRYELGRLVAVPPTADEIDAARRYAVGSLLISLDSQGGYASTMASLAADDVSVQWLRDHPARLEAVTVEEVAAAARRVLRAERVHRRHRRRRGRHRARPAGAGRGRPAVTGRTATRPATIRPRSRLRARLSALRWRDAMTGPTPGTAEVVRFDLLAPPVLSRSAVLRDETLRHGPRAAAGRLERGAGAGRRRRAGRVPVAWTGRAPDGPVGDGHGRHRAPGDGARPPEHAPPEEAVLLGEADGVAYWAVRDPAESSPGRTRSTGPTCASREQSSTRWVQACSSPPSRC